MEGHELFISGELPPGQGVRSDLRRLAERLQDGSTVREIAISDPLSFIRYHRGIERWISVTRRPPPREKPTVLVYWGPTGVGKSRKVAEDYPDAYWWPRPINGHAYAHGLTVESSATIVFDDFYSWIPYDFLLRLCDRYPLNVNISGGSVTLQTRTVVFTSNQNPRSWYPNITNKDAFFRRVTRITHMTNPLGPVNSTESFTISTILNANTR